MPPDSAGLQAPDCHPETQVKPRSSAVVLPVTSAVACSKNASTMVKVSSTGNAQISVDVKTQQESITVELMCHGQSGETAIDPDQVRHASQPSQAKTSSVKLVVEGSRARKSPALPLPANPNLVSSASGTPRAGSDTATTNPPDINVLASAVAAAKLGLTDQLATAIQTSGAVATARDTEARTCLHYAAGYGHDECVDLLLQHSADAAAIDVNGDLPLHFAAIHGHPMCAYNITKAATSACLAKNNRGQTPVELAVACERGEVLNAMLLACAADIGEPALKAMGVLLKCGAVADTWAPNGSSALMLAASVNGTDALKLLLEHGATIELQDALGRNALMFAAGNSAKHTLVALLDAGACIAARDRRGRCPLDYAPDGSDVKVILEKRLKDLEEVAAARQRDLLLALESEEPVTTANSKKNSKSSAKKAKKAAQQAAKVSNAASKAKDVTDTGDESTEADTASASAPTPTKTDKPSNTSETSNKKRLDPSNTASVVAAEKKLSTSSTTSSSAKSSAAHKQEAARIVSALFGMTAQDDSWQTVGTKASRKANGRLEATSATAPVATGTTSHTATTSSTTGKPPVPSTTSGAARLATAAIAAATTGRHRRSSSQQSQGSAAAEQDTVQPAAAAAVAVTATSSPVGRQPRVSGAVATATASRPNAWQVPASSAGAAATDTGSSASGSHPASPGFACSQQSATVASSGTASPTGMTAVAAADTSSAAHSPATASASTSSSKNAWGNAANAAAGTTDTAPHLASANSTAFPPLRPAGAAADSAANVHATALASSACPDTQQSPDAVRSAPSAASRMAAETVPAAADLPPKAPLARTVSDASGSRAAPADGQRSQSSEVGYTNSDVAAAAAALRASQSAQADAIRASQSAQADAHRLAAEVAHLRRKLNAAELAHQQELAAVLEDAAAHESAAVQAALAEERLRIVTHLLSVGLSPSLIVAVMSQDVTAALASSAPNTNSIAAAAAANNAAAAAAANNAGSAIVQLAIQASLQLPGQLTSHPLATLEASTSLLGLNGISGMSNGMSSSMSNAMASMSLNSDATQSSSLPAHSAPFTSELPPLVPFTSNNSAAAPFSSHLPESSLVPHNSLARSYPGSGSAHDEELWDMLPTCGDISANLDMSDDEDEVITSHLPDSLLDLSKHAESILGKPPKPSKPVKISSRTSPQHNVFQGLNTGSVHGVPTLGHKHGSGNSLEGQDRSSDAGPGSFNSHQFHTPAFASPLFGSPLQPGPAALHGTPAGRSSAAGSMKFSLFEDGLGFRDEYAGNTSRFVAPAVPLVSFPGVH